jgi:hypothetical protein
MPSAIRRASSDGYGARCRAHLDFLTRDLLFY